VPKVYENMLEKSPKKSLNSTKSSQICKSLTKIQQPDESSLTPKFSRNPTKLFQIP
jgi:hypothetical protein